MKVWQKAARLCGFTTRQEVKIHLRNVVPCAFNAKHRLIPDATMNELCEADTEARACCDRCLEWYLDAEVENECPKEGD